MKPIAKHERTTTWPYSAPNEGKLARKARKARKKIRNTKRRAAKLAYKRTPFKRPEKKQPFAPDSPRLKDPSRKWK